MNHLKNIMLARHAPGTHRASAVRRSNCEHTDRGVFADYCRVCTALLGALTTRDAGKPGYRIRVMLRSWCRCFVSFVMAIRLVRRDKHDAASPRLAGLLPFLALFIRSAVILI
jgi:hypothetical protein